MICPTLFGEIFEYYAILVNAPVLKHMSEIKEQNITQIGKFSVYSSQIPDYSGRNPPEFLEFCGIPGFRLESAESGRNQWRNGKYWFQLLCWLLRGFWLGFQWWF